MSEFWENITADIAGDAILTGYSGEFKDMPVYEEVVGLIGTGKKVLDFGCGVGRNTKALAERSNDVIGYDYPKMLDLVPVENKSYDLNKISYMFDWDYIKTLKFDAVLASLVFQHIPQAELENYLKDLTSMTDTIVLHSRTWLDFNNAQILPILEQYYIIKSIEYTRDPNNPVEDHFIAILGTKHD